MGAMPTGTDEIAIDRMYADNNGLTIGDRLESGARSWIITGLGGSARLQLSFFRQ